MATADLACLKDSIVASTTYGSGQMSHNVAGSEATRTLYILMDFEALPAITNVTSAKLYMTRTTAPSALHNPPDSGASIRVQRITGDWQEGNKGAYEATPPHEFYYISNAVTWTNKPAVSTPDLTALGSQPSTDETQWNVEIKDIVNSWLGGTTKKGIQVRSNNDVLDICFHSRHNATASKRPFLRLTWGSQSSNAKPKSPTVVVL